MNSIEQRGLVYTALALLCLLPGTLLGSAAALLSFVQIVVVVEGVYWLVGTAARPLKD